MTQQDNSMAQLRQALAQTGLEEDQVAEVIDLLGVRSIRQLTSLEVKDITSTLKPGLARPIVNRFFADEGEAEELGTPTLDELQRDPALLGRAARMAHTSVEKFLQLLVTGNFQTLVTAFGLETAVKLYSPVPTNVGAELLRAALGAKSSRPCIAFVPDQYWPNGLPVVAVEETVQVITNILQGIAQPAYAMVGGVQVPLYRLGENSELRQVVDPLCYGEPNPPFMLNDRSARYSDISYEGIEMPELQFIAMAVQGGEMNPQVRADRQEIVNLARRGLDPLLTAYTSTAFHFRRAREDEKLPPLVRRVHEGGDGPDSRQSFRS